MESIHQKNHNRSFGVSVPGKALLFGEYGVMRGGAAVVVTLPAYRMGLNFSFVAPESKTDAVHRFVSAFLPEALHLAAHEFETIVAEDAETELRNFACYLSGFREFLTEHSVSAEVLSSFPPSLGFGSSSALLSCFHIALAKKIFGKSGPDQLEIFGYWQRLYDALILLQGRGSGYDVAVQTWAALNSVPAQKALILSYKNKAYGLHQERLNFFEPEVSPVFMDEMQRRLLGCFVETGVRSDTRAVLNKTMRGALPDVFFAAHQEFARQFLLEPTSETAARLCREASALAQAAELLPQTPEVIRFVNECERNRIPWKTMGAGHGDCLWVMAPRAVIEAIVMKSSASGMNVRFAFEEDR